MTEQPTNPKAAAKAAKAYAKASRKWYQKKRFIALIILGVLVVIGAATSGGGSDDTTDTSNSATETGTSGTNAGGDTKTEKKAEKKKAPAAVKVKATDLIKAFEENEFAADEKYKDKTLEISGVVNKVETELLDGDSYYLQIGGGGDFELLTVNCHDISKDELSKVSTGQPVTVIGEFDDGGSLGVEVKDCHLK